MVDKTTHLGNLDVDIPLDGYNIGYKTPALSWNELYREAFQASDTRFRGVSEFGIDKHEYSKNGSFRQGTLVYYDPRDTGPYTDGQDALADVPPGGTLHLASTEYDVAVQGRLVRGDPVIIEGEGRGGQAGPGVTNKITGTKLINTGNDAIGQPAIELEAPTGGQGRHSGSVIRDLTVLHHGSAPAIRFDSQVGSTLARVTADCQSTGTAGVEIVGRSWSNRFEQCNFNNFTDYGVLLDGSGSHSELYSAYTFSNNAGAPGIITRENFTMVIGGEDRVASDASGVVFEANPTGGLVFNRLFEDVATGVTINGGQAEQIDVWFPHAPLTGVDYLVNFQQADDCRAWFPQVRHATGGGAIARFGTGANHCGIIHDGGETRKANIAVNPGAVNSYQLIKAAIPHSYVADLVTDSNLVTQVDLDIDENSPVWHDGQQWRTTNPTVEGAGVYLSTDQTIPPDTAEPIAMDTATYGSALFDSTTGEITVEKAGVYELSLNYRMINVQNSTAIQALIYVNGTREFRTQALAGSGYMDGGRRLQLASGDTVEFRCYQFGSGDATLVGKPGLTFASVGFVGEI